MMRHLPNYKLVIAGKKETPYGEKVIREREELGLTIKSFCRVSFLIQTGIGFMRIVMLLYSPH